ncbi:hypothetical protein G6F57_005552 [Rhizopus arrhizus]|uniref:Peptidase M48 domain-containing protein n=1 Tax=Rhizopus oryzae TaxID=64495 RepID=A0A9P7BWR7_RHIOR|nr:hypothetical protein G6F24_000359 [Rhizopus arrhizus]KAG1424721.1 hypothetical protein G6F58_002256 [Rhizopus delemar]KAG0792112.1 hypothetical protein G6F21_004590 [Rhizopus arrhizus]KAG0798469.1 hypothetical protein G6F22_004193 [Rhizopus arrhizus]KAG0817065.1 hypothetical protein G6F20_002686 [Rhizopus arrhizus]
MSTPLRSSKEASNLMGTYMLQGWVMTDQICSIKDCSFPLMRSKDGSISFCTYHDPLPNNASGPKNPVPEPSKNPEPVIEADELAVRRQRREQSSRASQLIGQKMLQKWALLNENCPNSTCYAIPLVRHPETKQMYCVICENIILTDKEKEAQPQKGRQEKPIVTETKRPQEQQMETNVEKKVAKRTIHSTDVFSSQTILSTLSTKMNNLNDRLKESEDPSELNRLFKSIKSCAEAIKACVEAGRVQTKGVQQRSFHPSRRAQVPLVPFPAFLMGAFKTGKLVSIISLSSKTSLTLLPHTFGRGGRLDQAPNTSRLRLIYLSEEEEDDVVKDEISTLLESHRGLVASRESELVQWLQIIVDNLATVAADDIREPVRRYTHEKTLPIEDKDDDRLLVNPSNDVETIVNNVEDLRTSITKRNFEIDVICDSTTVNAMCVGSHIVVYDMLVHVMEYDATRMAVILSHEIAHSIQRHFVEQHGFAALMLMLGDITRGVFWMVTESLGPYVNQKINDYISTFITLETQTTYNRLLEKEADLVGLKLLAKAGYDPRVAVEVWQKMAELEAYVVKKEVRPANNNSNQNSNQSLDTYDDLQVTVLEFLSTLINNWFGSSHPPSEERLQYMVENMDEAILIYEESIRLNGYPKNFVQEQQELLKQKGENGHNLLSSIKNWFVSVYHRMDTT